MAEVGTTVEVYDLSVSVQRTYVLTHTLRDIGHIPTAWVSILFVYLEGIRQPNSLNKQRLDTPLSFYAVGKFSIKNCPNLGICRTLKTFRSMKKVLLTVIGMMALVMAGNAQTTMDDIQQSEKRVAELQKLLENKPQRVGVSALDNYSEAVNAAAVLAIENSNKLSDFYKREIGGTKDGVTDVTIKKPTLEEWINLAATIAGEATALKKATESATEAVKGLQTLEEQVKSESNPLKKGKVAKNAKGGAAIIAFGKDALPIIGEESAAQVKAVQGIIETLKSGKNL